MKKRVVVPTLALILVGMVAVGAGAVRAQNLSFRNEELVQKVAESVGLDESEVIAVLDAVRDEHQAAMQDRFEERLAGLVSEGTITEEQMQAIIAKHEELRAKHDQNREEFQNMSPEERHEAMEKVHSEMEEWAKSIGIDPDVLGHFEMREGGAGHRGPKPFVE